MKNSSFFSVISRRGSRARCTWINNGSSRSMGSMPAADGPPSCGPPSSLEAETLGAYLRSYIADITQNSTLQRFSSQDASTNMNHGYEGSCEASVDIVGNNESGNTCTCQGACGCAIDNESRNVTVDDLPRTKNAIIKLLGSSNSLGRSPARTNLNSTTVSKSSTPDIVLDRTEGSEASTKTTSIGSNDSCDTGISNLSSVCSNDEFEIISEVTNFNSAVTTPGHIPRMRNQLPPGSRSCSVGDLQSLSAGMKVLDSYLAARGIPVIHKLNQSLEALYQVQSDDARQNKGEACAAYPHSHITARIWRSTDDTLI